MPSRILFLTSVGFILEMLLENNVENELHGGLPISHKGFSSLTLRISFSRFNFVHCSIFGFWAPHVLSLRLRTMITYTSSFEAFVFKSLASAGGHFGV